MVSKIYRQRALDYIDDGHRAQFAEVVLARIGRDWGLFRPLDMQFINESEGRPRWVTTLGMWWYYPLAALALVGAVLLHRRRVRIWPLAVPPVIVTVGTLLSYGQTRFRVPAEPVIVVLAACAISTIAAAIAARGRPAPPGDRSPSLPGAAA